jgi:leucyl-tRNA synthetase
MSKSKFNVVNPDAIIERYGADTLRLYEMFLGPLEQSKPWDTQGIEGTYRFLRKFWGLFFAGEELSISDDAPTKEELKTLHATLKKLEEDIERMSFNTCVSQFMIALNELHGGKCNKRAILEPLTIALAPFAPHMCDELWELLGNKGNVIDAPWPAFDEKHLVQDSFTYPISFNGKVRMQLEIAAGLDKEAIESLVMEHAQVQERLDGKAPKKVIVVPKRIVNIVV